MTAGAHTTTTSASADTVLMGSGRATIYGDYVAPAVAASGAGRWHIEGDQPDLALCGQRLSGSLRRMRLHVSLLECPSCMSRGATHPTCAPATPPASPTS